MRTTNLTHIVRKKSALCLRIERYKSTFKDTGGRGRTDTPEGTRF